MSDFNLADPRGWECDLQSVYSAYMGHFQLHNVPWYERSWGIFFQSFEAFLTFAWPVITVTDSWTGRAHIVTRMTSVGAFIKMIKTRFGETLPLVDNILRVSPFETAQRHLRTVSDYATYKKLHATLPSAVLAALKVRIRNGEPKGVRDLWDAKDKTFLAIDFEWSERNTSSCLEVGYAAVRCGHLDAVGTWPPDPEPNYRRGHYIVAEYVDKVHNRYRPNFPWAYAFGESQVVPKAKLPQLLQAVISSLASPDSETLPNTLVLVAHGISGDLRRLEEMKIKLPHNVLIIDTAAYERRLFTTGHRGIMQGSSGKPREPGSLLSLTNLLQSLGVDVQCTMHNSGNDAFMCLLAFQLLLDPEHTKIPTPRNANRSALAMARGMNRSPSILPSIALMPTPPLAYSLGATPPSSVGHQSPRTPDEYFDQDVSPRPMGYAHAVSMNGRGLQRLSALPPTRPRRASSANPSPDIVEQMNNLAVKDGV
ncbi:hypothetical protein SCP_0101380 [Sparassis crispa]|uniref:Gfd2/YDR514C-like C-terminal domain-containing protein n=1 Tax=Sparassis crispa TaxID=139825 RepID=A0A401G526_9APHY|nr:hypothetical protein SCP_0101380 [Sparassis crispa]GBE77265.1 hypothetical protein SCP_0101380 [Sparassis crispa]